MSRVRDFRKTDIPAVADLWLKVFYQRQPASESLRLYFEEMFFNNPWYEESMPSFVYEDNELNIVGFLGVVPRLMTFNHRTIKVAATSQLVVDKSNHRGHAALELIRSFFAGPQDLSLTDAANDEGRRIWEAARSEVATLYSCIWTRILRPSQYFLGLIEKWPPFGFLAPVSMPIAGAVDATVARLPKSPYPLPLASALGEEATVESLLACISQLPRRWELRPKYDLESLRWLLQRANESRRRGQLHKLIVRDETGEILGWYLYYGKAGGVSKVLQIGGSERGITRVINHLFEHAWRQGSVAISGRLEPRFAKQLSDSHCNFSFANLSVLVHSKDNNVLNTIHRGQAFLSRLEGEWWMRFHEETWL